MNWPKFYVMSVLLHFVVLFGVWPSVPRPEPTKGGLQYMEVSLVATPDLAKKPAEPDSMNLPESTAVVADSIDLVTPLPNSAVVSEFGEGAAAGRGQMSKPGIFGKDTGNASTGGLVSSRFGQWRGHYYEIVAVPTGINWYDAEAAAKARGGFLAILPRISTIQDAEAAAKARGIYKPGRLYQPDNRDYFAQIGFIFNFTRFADSWRRESAKKFLTSASLFYNGVGTLGLGDDYHVRTHTEPIWIGPWIGDILALRESRVWDGAIHQSDERAWRAWYDESAPANWFKFAYVSRTELAYSYLVEYDHDPRSSSTNSSMMRTKR